MNGMSGYRVSSSGNMYKTLPRKRSRKRLVLIIANITGFETKQNVK